jgi:hypothetical protein
MLRIVEIPMAPIVLKSVAGANDNNILLLETAKTSIDLKNSIRLDAGS